MPDWKGFFSDPKFYELDPEKQMQAFSTMAGADPAIASLTPDQQFQFANKMAEMNQPRVGGPTLEGEFAPESTRLAAPDELQPENLLRAKAAYEAQQANPEMFEVNQNMESARQAGRDAGSDMSVLKATKSMLDFISGIPVVGKPYQEFTQQLGKRLPGIVPGLTTAVTSVPDLAAAAIQGGQLLTGEPGIMQPATKGYDRVQAVRDWWKRDVADPAFKKALDIQAFAEGLAEQAYGAPDAAQRFGMADIDPADPRAGKAEKFVDGVVQVFENFADAAKKGGFRGTLEFVGGATGEVTATALPTALVMATGNEYAAFMMAHSYLQSEAKQAQIGLPDQDSEAGIFLKTTPLAMLDMLGTKGIIKGWKPGLGATTPAGKKLAQ